MNESALEKNGTDELEGEKGVMDRSHLGKFDKWKFQNIWIP